MIERKSREVEIEFHQITIKTVGGNKQGMSCRLAQREVIQPKQHPGIDWDSLTLSAQERGKGQIYWIPADVGMTLVKLRTGLRSCRFLSKNRLA